MKNNKTIEKIKSFDTVKTFREIKDKISEETAEMNFDQIKEYINRKSQEFRREQELLPNVKPL